jgi:hypothetical protein
MFRNRNRLLFATAAALTLAACGGQGQGQGQNALIPPAAQGQAVAPGAAAQGAVAQGAVASLSTAEGAAFDLIRARRPMVIPETVGSAKSMCPGVVVAHTMHCMALVENSGGLHRLGADVTPDAAPLLGSYGPVDLQSAYALAAYSKADGKTQTVAIVDAQDDPKAESDLDVYRAYYKLPACTTANKCFRKVSQTGTTTYPAPDQGWAGEISLDVDMVSAICPNCKIILVEAADSSDTNLGKAVDEAVALGANVVSNSYGGDEFEPSDADYVHPGHVITASTGDGGYYPQVPAAYSSVVAVGGTTLKKGGGTRGWTESAWVDGGSGCSLFVAKPSWQAAQTICPTRQIGDISAEADPNTGVAVYDSYPNPYGIPLGWAQYGGTSASSPIIGAVYALAQNAASATPATLWAHGGSADFYDITTGTNGACPAVWKYICTARVGYDGPTGWGTPHTTAGF